MTGQPPPRDDNETTTRTPKRPCPICGSPFTPIRRQLYCTNACRQTAHRRRKARTPAPVPPAGQRRDHTIYQCPDCDNRYHAQQWCDDCNRPCRRLGTGGLCAHCGETLTIEELLAGETMT